MWILSPGLDGLQGPLWSISGQSWLQKLHCRRWRVTLLTSLERDRVLSDQTVGEFRRT
jgi:hypothetical protein